MGLKLLKPYGEHCAGSLSFPLKKLISGRKISHNKKIPLELIKNKQAWVINNKIMLQFKYANISERI